MRLVIQRVRSSNVSVSGKIVGKIDAGLLILVGISQNDTEEDTRYLAEKVVKMRILSDDRDKMNMSVIDKKQEILAISQFTLYADTKKGNRPSFIKAALPNRAKKLYEYFVEYIKDKGIKVATGKFGEYMDIEAKLDGPVTIILESDRKDAKQES